ncbi:unnamed protein product [Somion occarium]|uniref:Uncharacterized protein n=1 Tax=Somion occarium TaxID=3059160 RepID=A0ABP1CRN3_9APHY
MKPVYVALPNSPLDDHEAKPFVQSESTEELYRVGASSVKTLSTKMTVLAYILCALTVLLASANLASSIYNACYSHGHNTSIDKLPRPDIFAGLPKNPTMGHHVEPSMPASHTEDSHGHAHEHEHNHAAQA